VIREEPIMTMIEKVARALFNSVTSDDEADLVYHTLEDSRDTWERIARAAIAAMREPSAGMVEAGASAISASVGHDADRFDKLQDAADCHHAMIEAALAEGTEAAQVDS
jgi:hypothetical protein